MLKQSRSKEMRGYSLSVVYLNINSMKTKKFQCVLFIFALCSGVPRVSSFGVRVPATGEAEAGIQGIHWIHHQ